jgi:glyoxylase-like metal-dependent hydrolase (beta-lactamase superfamily II)
MVTRLAAGVWWLDLQGVNAYVLEDDDGVTLVDTGMPWQRSRLARDLGTAVGGLGAVDRVLITHFDFDHVGGLERLGRTDATVYVGTADEPYLSGRERPDWRNWKGAFQRAADLFRTPPDLPIETVDDGDAVGGFRAYSTPGHTPGHTCFVHEELPVAFLGDLVRESEGAFECPPWFLNHDHDRAGRSVVDFADRSPDFEIACQGHGTPFVTDGSSRLAACARSLAETAGSVPAAEGTEDPEGAGRTAGTGRKR